MSEEKINQMVLKVKNYLVDVLKYVKEEDELVYPYDYFYDTFNCNKFIKYNINKFNDVRYQGQNIYKKLEETLIKFKIVAIDMGKYGITKINLTTNDYSNSKIINNHYIVYLSSNGDRYITLQMEKPFISFPWTISEKNLYINWGYEFIIKPFTNEIFNYKINILQQSLIDYAIINNLLLDLSNAKSYCYKIDAYTGKSYRNSNFIHDYKKLIICDNITDKLKLHNENYEKEQLKIEKELLEKQKIEKEQEELKRIKILDENIKVLILDTSLKIENYYKPKINLKDYLPHKIKKIIIKGILNQIEITNITEVIFVNCDFTEITDYYEGIKIMYLTDCPNFKQIPIKLQSKLSKLFIDTEEVEFC